MTVESVCFTTRHRVKGYFHVTVLRWLGSILREVVRNRLAIDNGHDLGLKQVVLLLLLSSCRCQVVLAEASGLLLSFGRLSLEGCLSWNYRFLLDKWRYYTTMCLVRHLLPCSRQISLLKNLFYWNAVKRPEVCVVVIWFFLLFLALNLIPDSLEIFLGDWLFCRCSSFLEGWAGRHRVWVPFKNSNAAMLLDLRLCDWFRQRGKEI